MNFFDQQQSAKRATRLLLGLFLLALALLTLLVNSGIYTIYSIIHHFINDTYPPWQHYATSPICWVTTGITLLLFTLGSAQRWLQLRRNRLALVSLIDAVELSSQNASAEQKILINVVEEMAVVSGLSVPRLFLMPQEGSINAFVAGRAPQQLLVVTQGMLDKLSRDQLQGVIGHEFSHLLNGDSQLNLKMLAWLAGLSRVAQLGNQCMQAASSVQQHQRLQLARSKKNDANVRPALLLLGGILYVAGYCGLFLGRIIKASISRQREVLADASSRQFTRNPRALGDALIKIKQHGSLLIHPNAEEISHMCFADGTKPWLHQLLATHPDIDTRLHQIDPSWVARSRARLRPKTSPAVKTSNVTALLPDKAQSVIAAIPDTLHQALHQPDQAMLVVYALLMSLSQQQRLPAINPAQRLELAALNQQLQAFTNYRLILIDLSLPALQRLSNEKQQQLLDNLDRLIALDGEVTLSKYLLRETVRHKLRPSKPVVFEVNRIVKLAPQIQLLLSRLIQAVSWRHSQQQRLFTYLAAPLLPKGYQLLSVDHCGLKELAGALHQLRRLTSKLKQSLLLNCQSIVIVDNKLTTEENELLRLICILIDAPLPQLRLPPNATNRPVANRW